METHSHVLDHQSTHHSHVDIKHDPNGRDEFLAIIIGQLIRLYAKSKTLSQSFTDFEYLERMADLCKHEQFIIQSDAQKTFEAIMMG